jgi:formiminotetrahydrofolate cyclodeaminase
LKLEELSLRRFIRELSSGSAMPGGGSVAALCGSMGAALSAMVARLTLGREKFRGVWERMERIEETADDLAERFLLLAQEDTEAYQEVIAALRLAGEGKEGKSLRDAALQEAMKKATCVPLETLRVSEKLLRMAREAVEHGNPVAVSDAGAAVHLAHAAAEVAAYNVRINLAALKDNSFVERCKREAGEILARMEPLLAEADGYVNAHLG